eukprot:97835_1
MGNNNTNIHDGYNTEKKTFILKTINASNIKSPSRNKLLEQTHKIKDKVLKSIKNTKEKYHRYHRTAKNKTVETVNFYMDVNITDSDEENKDPNNDMYDTVSEESNSAAFDACHVEHFLQHS